MLAPARALELVRAQELVLLHQMMAQQSSNQRKLRQQMSTLWLHEQASVRRRSR